MWQSSEKDEDASDTWVAYSRSLDGGQTWTEPMVLAKTLDNGYCSSGGWLSTADTLVAFINTWSDGVSPKGGYTRYVKSTDGLVWTEPDYVMMADGSRMDAIFEQDPHIIKGGRIVNAAHFQPGLMVCPIYTDHELGTRGWKKGVFTCTDNGSQSRELEPSLYQRDDGSLVMVFRDQNGTYRKLASVSTDNGETWTEAVVTDMPDARTKQSAGNLPDGTAYFAGNPVTNKTRIPLVLTLSRDGRCFDQAYLLREGGASMPTLRYSGSAKRAGYHYPKSMVANGYLYVSYALNKEDVQYTKIPLNGISLSVESTDMEQISVKLADKKLTVTAPDDIDRITITSGNGMIVYAKSRLKGHEYVSYLSGLGSGVYVVSVAAGNTLTVKKIVLKQ